MARKKTARKRVPKQVEALTHGESKRTYIPTAEYQSVVDDELLAVDQEGSGTSERVAMLIEVPEES